MHSAQRARNLSWVLAAECVHALDDRIMAGCRICLDSRPHPVFPRRRESKRLSQYFTAPPNMTTFSGSVPFKPVLPQCPTYAPRLPYRDKSRCFILRPARQPIVALSTINSVLHGVPHACAPVLVI